jgi:hypothetical protein
METREIPIEVTRNGKTYEIVVEMRGESSGCYRPATRLDPEEFAEFEIHEFKFISADGLLEDVVDENDPDGFHWIRRIDPSRGGDIFESLDVSVNFKGKTLDVAFDRSTPFDAFKLSDRSMFIFELEEYALNFVNEESE